ncbi:cytochrome P450 [Flammula alnicola]|nr:cytochrome P450 [Flammula alnicola]
MTFYNYGEKWKEHRRAMHQNLNNRAVREWRQLQQDVTTKFLKKMVVNPNDWLYRIEHLTGSAIMKLHTGIGFLVDKLPILRYVPSWFPGARFKRFAEAERILHSDPRRPFKNTKDRWIAGNAAACYVTRLFEEFGGAEVPKEKERVIKETSAVLYAAGTDSVSRLVLPRLHPVPEVQKAAREEIDRVVGTGRLPTFADRESLPYIDALVKELLRWNPAAPLAPSHQILVDDEYEGHLIPAGTIIHPNIWSMTHNDEIYPKPFDFKPERFLGLSEERAKEIDPRNFVLGLGGGCKAKDELGRRSLPFRIILASLGNLTGSLASSL